MIRGFLGTKNPDRRKEFDDAKSIKARALLQLGAAAENPNWRNWYVTSARELQGYPLPNAITGGLVSPGVVGALPAGSWVNSLTMRLRAEDTAPVPGQKSMGFWFPAPGGQGDQGFGPLGYVLVVRGGIAELVQQTPEGRPLSREDVAKATYAISIEQPTLAALLDEEAKGAGSFREALEKAYAEHKILTLNGTIQEFERAFFGWFDPKPVDVPPLTVGLPMPNFSSR